MLYKHNTREISFTLFVDDFGIFYKSKDDLQHLQNTINAKYTTTFNDTGSLYCGLNIAWNYEKQHVDISMPGYIKRGSAQFNATTSK